MESLHIGVDLGTTNTVVSAFGKDGLKPIKFFPDKAIFPSLVLKYQPVGNSSLIGISKDKTKIGSDAINYFLKIYEENRDENQLQNYKIFSEYKRQILSDPKSISLTKEVLGYILKKIQNESLNPISVESLVVTVPHIWGPESRERQKMKELILSLGIKEVHLISEPIAAAVYYAYKRTHRTKECVLICDLGGGTQDYTLCNIHTDDSVEVLDNEGSRESGGAIIDDCLREKIQAQLQTSLDAHDLFYLKLKAEELKLKFNKNIEMELQEDSNESILTKAWKWVKNQFNLVMNYVLNKLYSLKPIEITIKTQTIKVKPEDLESATNLVLPKVEKHITEIQRRNPNVSIQKVVLVGGSSNNVFFQAKIRDLLGVEIVMFTPEDRYMGISYGASLFGSKQIQVKEQTSFHYGIMVQIKGELKPLSILPKGTEFGKKVVSKESFKPIRGSSGSTPIVVWRDESEIRQLDNFNIPNQNVEVRYAMSIDTDGVLVVECLDKNGNLIDQKKFTGIHQKLTDEEISKLIQPYASDIEIASSLDKTKLVEEYEIEIEGKKVLLYNGDITWLNVDVIVSSDNSQREMPTGVSLAIKNRAGESVLQELKASQLNLLHVIVTGAGKMRNKKIFHAIIHEGNTIHSPKEITKNCIELADKMKFESMAIPIFGTGGLGLDFQKTSREIFEAIQENLPKTQNLKLLVVSIPLNQNFQVFKGVIK